MNKKEPTAQEVVEALTECFKSIGLSESGALSAAKGRDLIDTADGVEETLIECFKTMGLSESAAKSAAKGRGDQLVIQEVEQVRSAAVFAAARAEEARAISLNESAARVIVQAVLKK